MGTRSLTKVIQSWTDENGNKKEQTLTTMYKQMDGYMSGYGADLSEFLKDISLVNGIGIDEKRQIANGMSCLAAQLFAHFKDGAGGIYLYPPESTDCGEEYIYTIREAEDNEISLEVYDTYDEKVIFNGSPKQLLSKLKYKENGKA